MSEERFTEELNAKLTAWLIDFLQREFEDTDIFELFKPIIPATVDFAISEGLQATQDLIEGVVSGDSYPSWERLTQLSSPEDRIKIMEQTRQVAIQDKLLQIKRNKQAWIIFKTSLNILLSALLALL